MDLQFKKIFEKSIFLNCTFVCKTQLSVKIKVSNKLDLSIFSPEKNAYFTKFMLYVFTAMQLVTYSKKSILCGKINSLLKAFNLCLC